LGRARVQRRASQQRRKVLRAICPVANADSYANAGIYSNSNSDSNTNSDTNTNSKPYAHADTDAMHGEMFTDAQATSHAGAASVSSDLRSE
jgi:hypothetical protein